MLKKGFKRMLILLLCMIVLFGFSININKTSTTAYAASSFAKGADIGWLNQLENKGVKWQNSNGIQKDALQILKDSGINSVRLRVFVNPPSNFQWTKNDGTTCLLGYEDTKGVIYMAQRAKNLGMGIMIDFHYSDHFADPAYQDKPSAWANDSFIKLKQNVYDHTNYVMSALAKAGVLSGYKWAMKPILVCYGLMEALVTTIIGHN